MIKIKRTSHIDVIKECLKKDIVNGGSTWYIMIDNRDGCIVFLRGPSNAKFYTKVEVIKFKNTKPTLKNVSRIASQILFLLDTFNKKCCMCYSRAVSTYGKKNVIPIAFVKALNNPYYTCAPKMRLYDKNVIEYYMNRGKK